METVDTMYSYKVYNFPFCSVSLHMHVRIFQDFITEDFYDHAERLWKKYPIVPSIDVRKLVRKFGLTHAWLR